MTLGGDHRCLISGVGGFGCSIGNNGTGSVNARVCGTLVSFNTSGGLIELTGRVGALGGDRLTGRRRHI